MSSSFMLSRLNGLNRFAPLAAALAATLWAMPAAALFKVVNPDGTVSYVDRPPQVVPNSRITSLSRPGQPTLVTPGVPLPPELQQPVSRHPVTLYTTSECSPCDSGRQLLATRGVPYTERRVASEEDAQLFERLFGTRTLPLVTVGSTPLRGLSDVEWAAYLDAAGYPKQSRLPRGWQPPPATTLTERAAPPPARPQPAPAPTPAPPPQVETETQSTGTRIRF
jgi:glutaredoxin